MQGVSKKVDIPTTENSFISHNNSAKQKKKSLRFPLLHGAFCDNWYSKGLRYKHLRFSKTFFRLFFSNLREMSQELKRLVRKLKRLPHNCLTNASETLAFISQIPAYPVSTCGKLWKTFFLIKRAVTNFTFVTALCPI